MRIARISHLFYPDMISDCLFEFSMRQTKIGHKVDVITWNKNKRCSEENVIEDFTIHRLLGLNFSVDGAIIDYPYLPSLPSKIAQLKPDIIHAHSHLFLTTFSAVKEAKKLRIPSVVTVHGVSAERNTFINLAQHSYLYTVGRWIFKNATRIICLTRSDVHEVMKYGAERAKIRIIPNAVDVNLFKPSKRKSNSPLFVWVGRFVPEKGLHYLVKAIEVVVTECKDAKFILIGDGPMLPMIKTTVKKSGLTDYVRFTGFMHINSVSHILSKATGFVFPSLKEGMPKAVLEAMACGLPIIASNIRGVNEIMRDGYNGLLVPPREPTLMAKAIIKLLNDNNLNRRLGQQARLSALNRYNWDLMIDKIHKIYCDAIAE